MVARVIRAVLAAWVLTLSSLAPASVLALQLPVTGMAAAAADKECQEVATGDHAAADVVLKARLVVALCRDNNVAASGLAFLAGLLTSLSPCVYPLIPITIAVFGARQATSRLRAFGLSLSYVVGMSVLYTALGVLFASLGLISGGLMAIPAVVMGIGALCLAMAASMFGAFEVALPAGVQTRLSQVGGSGFRGAFLMGLVAGIIAAPCTGPVLAVILSLISRSGEPGRGAVLMAFYSLGMGSLFLVLGTFSSVLSKLPRSGRWMESVKSVLGLFMIVAAVYLVKPHVSVLSSLTTGLGELPNAVLLGTGLVVVAVILGALHLSFKDEGMLPRARKGMGLVVATAGLLTLLGWVEHLPPAPSSAAAIAWLRNHDEGVAAGKSQGRPVMIDFGADWCAACKELEHVTYRDATVAGEARRFVNVMVDSTEMSDAMTALWQKYGITGLPAVVFIDSTGQVMKEPRVEGFLQPADFLAEMKKVR